MSESLEIHPLADCEVLRCFPELQGKVTVRDSWLAYCFNPILGGSFADRKTLDDFIEICTTSGFSLVLAVFFSMLLHNSTVGVVVFVLTFGIMTALSWNEKRQGKLRLASGIIGSVDYGVFLSPRLRRDGRKRTFSLAFQLSRVLGEVEHLGPRRMAHERLDLPFPTLGKLQENE